jgi:hypothetical protein
MYFFGKEKKELSCCRLMERDIFNQRTDSESQGLSYLFIICISLWKNSFMKKKLTSFLCRISIKVPLQSSSRKLCLFNLFLIFVRAFWRDGIQKLDF